MSKPDPAITADLLKQIPGTKSMTHAEGNPAIGNAHTHPMPSGNAKDHTHTLSRATNGANHMRSNNRGK